jgi:hypothetical protein
LSAREGRKFALTVGTAFLALAAIAWWRGREIPVALLGAVGAILWVAGLLVPSWLGGLHRAWMGLAHAISRVTTPVFLGVVYFAVMMPIGIVMRAVGRNPIRHHPREGSYWARPDGRGNLTNQF